MDIFVENKKPKASEDLPYLPYYLCKISRDPSILTQLNVRSTTLPILISKSIHSSIFHQTLPLSPNSSVLQPRTTLSSSLIRTKKYINQVPTFPSGKRGRLEASKGIVVVVVVWLSFSSAKLDSRSEAWKLVAQEEGKYRSRPHR